MEGEQEGEAIRGIPPLHSSPTSLSHDLHLSTALKDGRWKQWPAVGSAASSQILSPVRGKWFNY